MVGSPRNYDIGIVGATGFTGHLVMKRIFQIRPDLKVLASSRHPDSLQFFIESINIPNVSPYDSAVDSASYHSVLEFVSQVKIVISCAGPFHLVGVPIVRGCIQRGTHYVDIAGEVDFIRRVIDEFGAHARIGNILVIPACGFDSVPSDLGVFYAQTVSGSPITRAQCFVSVKGSPSGGTLRTLFSAISDPLRLKIAQDAYALNERLDDVCEPGKRPSKFEADVHGISYNSSLQKWISPAAMASINTRAVRRTASLYRVHPERGLRYHNDFSYQEVNQSNSVFAAVFPYVLSKILLPLKWFLSWPLLNRIVQWFLPAPGEKGGPSEEKRKRNYFHYTIQATTQEGDEVEVQVYGGDPYEVTADTVSRAALCIIDNEEDIIRELGGGGVFTAAFALGQRYLDQLMQSDLINFEPMKTVGTSQSPAIAG